MFIKHFLATFLFILPFLMLGTKQSQAVQKNNKPWLRLDNSLNYIKADPKKGRYVAYSDKIKGALHILDLKSQKNVMVSDKNIDGSFVWSPDGIRLIYREQVKENGKISGNLMVFDMFLNKSIKLDEISSQSGFITFDPRDYRLLLMHEDGVISKSLKLPDSRLAKWQLKTASQKGRWAAGPGGIVYLSPSGHEMKKLTGDGSGVESFDISPNGEKIVWTTNKSAIFYAEDGNEGKFLDVGRDAKWSNSSNQIIYAGAQLIGRKVSGYDIKLSDLHGNKKWITQTPLSMERWPEMLPNGTVLYTKAASTDLYSLEVKSRN